MNRKIIGVILTGSLVLVAMTMSGCIGWKEKAFSELSDKEIEATMNIEKRVFDEVLGKDIPKYYQTESLLILKESGYFYGELEKTRKLAKPIVAVSVAYPSVKINESVIYQIEKKAESKEIEWEGIKVSIIDCIVQVDPQGAGVYYDKITIYPLKVKVLE